MFGNTPQKILSGGIVMLLSNPITSAQTDANNTTAPTELDKITVTATRSERAVEDIAGTVSVIDEEDIERNLVRNIEDLVRYEPGVTVDSSGRFGLSGFRIRGIGGDRVLTTIDGIRIADEFSFGPFQDSNRDFVDVDALKSVEIVRGPASSLYGSDAIGGVVAFLTKDPADYLGIFNENSYIAGKAGYSGDDDSVMGTLTLAGRQGPLEALLLFTRRDGHETGSYGGRGGTGPERQQANPQDVDSDNVLAKLVFKPNEQHEFKFTFDKLDGETETDVLSNAGTVTFGTTTEQQTGIDQRERERWSLDYRFDGSTAVFDTAQLKLYRQTSDTDQRTEELRNSPVSGRTFRSRDSLFEQELTGTSVQFDKSFSIGGIGNYLIYGGEYYTIDGDNLRTGATFDAATGAPVRESTAFPTRGFPLSETTQYAAYIQDEITLLDGRLSLTPGLRYDSYELDADADSAYVDSNPGIDPPEDFDDSHVSPKLGAVFRIDNTWSLFAQYAEGFRAPPYDDINIGFTNLAGGYKTIPNPNLKPETSESFEAGIRAGSRWGSFSLAAFHNDYEDFIESQAFKGIDPTDGLIVFQSENRGRVKIKGVELRSELFLDTLWAQAAGWRFNASIAYARGDDEEIDQPLDSIDPAKGVFGLAYDHAGGNWGGELVWTVVAKKDRVDESDPELQQFKTPGYGKLDLLGFYQLGEHSRLNFGVFNLTDKKYWQWGESLIGRLATDPGLDRLSQPGLYAGISFRTEW